MLGKSIISLLLVGVSTDSYGLYPHIVQAVFLTQLMRINASSFSGKCCPIALINCLSKKSFDLTNQNTPQLMS